jgi:hypothetical protein
VVRITKSRGQRFHLWPRLRLFDPGRDEVALLVELARLLPESAALRICGHEPGTFGFADECAEGRVHLTPLLFTGAASGGNQQGTEKNHDGQGAARVAQTYDRHALL